MKTSFLLTQEKSDWFRETDLGVSVLSSRAGPVPTSPPVLPGILPSSPASSRAARHPPEQPGSRRWTSGAAVGNGGAETVRPDRGMAIQCGPGTTGMDQQKNLRRHPRRTTQVAARLVFSWGVLDGSVENIGEGGIFFVTDTWEGRVEVGDRLTVEFPTPEEVEVNGFGGQVLRTERYFHRGEIFRAFAIRFESPYLPQNPS